MTNSYKASVIIPTYNSEKYINQTIQSILSQECDFPFEIIIVDDCSKDKTKEIITSIASKNPNIRLIFNEANLGVFANFNKAIHNCSTNYIAYCGHDDFWHNSTKLQKQYNFLIQNPDYGLVYSDFNLYNEGLQRTIYSFNKVKNRVSKTRISYKDLISHYSISSCTPCFRKDIYLKYIPVKDFIKHRFPVEDWPTYLIISINSKVGYIEESLATFRVGHESVSNSFIIDHKEDYMNGHERMFNYMKSIYPKEFSEYGEAYYPVYKNTVLLKYAYKYNYYQHAKKYAKRLSVLGQKRREIFFAKNWVLFNVFRVLKTIYRQLSIKRRWKKKSFSR